MHRGRNFRWQGFKLVGQFVDRIHQPQFDFPEVFPAGVFLCHLQAEFIQVTPDAQPRPQRVTVLPERDRSSGQKIRR